VHELRGFIDNIRNIWSSDDGILEGTIDATIEVRVGHGSTIKLEKGPPLSKGVL
jgi:hypothetical protein